MSEPVRRSLLSRLGADYGMLPVLVLLCVYFSFASIAENRPAGAEGGDQLGRNVAEKVGSSGRVLVVAGEGPEEAAFAAAAKARLEALGTSVSGVAAGAPSAVRGELVKRSEAGERLGAVAASPTAAGWTLLEDTQRKFPGLGEPTVETVVGGRWPNFLTAGNLRNVASQIAVIAILAVGMTLVIVAGGIDLSVGSLVALSAVTAAAIIRDFGGENASVGTMILASVAAVTLCAAAGLFSGAMVTAFDVPPFIATLGMMLMAGGVAFMISAGKSISQIPPGFSALGAGTSLGGLPNSVLLAAGLYAAAHVVMTRTRLGRYVYAVGGNAEAARLSGAPVKRVLLFVYALSGALAGLGGVVTASQLKSGAPTFGQMYELQVIAAVVVGGASLSGGEGKVFGTLVGALIIAVIQNGMNLTGVESYTQRVVFGALILGAVLLDRLKRR